MDLLHRTLSSVGEYVYFICSSIEEPYYFVRMRGEIMESTVTDEHISYRLRLTEILEPTSVVRECIANKHFRMKCVRKKTSHYLDKVIRGTDLSDMDLVPGIIKRVQKNWFDISIMTTFLSQEEMDQKLSRVNQYNIDKLMKRVDFLSKRNANI